MWHVAKSLDGYLSKDFEVVEQAFKKAFSGESICVFIDLWCRSTEIVMQLK
jgi:hypothetical protein